MPAIACPHRPHGPVLLQFREELIKPWMIVYPELRWFILTRAPSLRSTSHAPAKPYCHRGDLPRPLQRPDTARLFYWLCGKADEYATVAGPAWPMRREGGEPHYGAPEDLRET